MWHVKQTLFLRRKRFRPCRCIVYLFIHRDITKIGRDWSFRTGVSKLSASDRGSTRIKETCVDGEVDREEGSLTSMNAWILEVVRHRRGVRL
jgi:hypothetical protein